MRRKHLFLVIAALLAAGGFWLARSAWRANPSAFREPSTATDITTPSGNPQPGQMPNPPAQLAPPDPSRRFIEFTPEQRVEFARRGHGPGG